MEEIWSFTQSDGKLKQTIISFLLSGKTVIIMKQITFKIQTVSICLLVMCINTLQWTL